MDSALRTRIKGKSDQSGPRSARNSRLLFAGALGALLLVLAACGSSEATSPTSTTAGNGSGNVKAVGLSVGSSQHGSLGTILIDQSGMTLYRHSPDGTGQPTCTGACAVTWPPLIAPAGSNHVVGTAGVATSELGTVTRPGGMLQVTFNGMPLYRFAGDTKSGDTKGQGLDGAWFVVSASVSPPMPSSTTTPPTTSPPSSPPPATPAPATKSPTATAPPATSPPATAPPATAPPATSPPATSPPATQPGSGGYPY
jgi:predicted lipoprotein with Yx(FWY)xxD motif